eukprot:760718-Hanusia_phi.AAC.1
MIGLIYLQTRQGSAKCLQQDPRTCHPASSKSDGACSCARSSSLGSSTAPQEQRRRRGWRRGGKKDRKERERGREEIENFSTLAQEDENKRYQHDGRGLDALFQSLKGMSRTSSTSKTL